MNSYSEAPDWELKVRLTGTCQHCGADVSGETRVRATTEWMRRYRSDAAFQRTVNLSIERIALARHARICLGAQLIEARPQPVWAVSA